MNKVDVSAVLSAGREMALLESVVVRDFGSYTFPSPANVELRLRRVDRGIDVSGVIQTEYAGACDRCLEDVHKALYVEVEERFEPTAADPLAESNVLDGSVLDVEDLVRQLVDTALPMTLLCSEACAGLCPGCGQLRNHPGCTCTPS